MAYHNNMYPDHHGLMQRADIHYFRRGEQVLKVATLKYIDAPPDMRAAKDDYAVVMLSLCNPFDFRHDVWDFDTEEKCDLGRFPAVPFNFDIQISEMDYRRLRETSLRHGVWYFHRLELSNRQQ